MLDKALLEIMVCPATKGPLKYEVIDGVEWLISEAKQLAYPVRDGIPVLLVDQAKPLGSITPIDSNPISN